MQMYHKLWEKKDTGHNVETRNKCNLTRNIILNDCFVLLGCNNVNYTKTGALVARNVTRFFSLV